MRKPKVLPILFLHEETEYCTDNAEALGLLIQSKVAFSLVPVEGRGIPSLMLPDRIITGLWKIKLYIQNQQNFALQSA